MLTAALVIGALLAVAAVFFVARPFLGREPDAVPSEPPPERLALEEERDRALVALKELEFDHRTGKISDDDYRSLVGDLRRDAAEALHGATLRAPAIDDPDELWVHRLIGARVVTVDGTDVGVVDAVEANPASDMLVLDSGALIPAVFVVEQRDDATVVVDPPDGLFDL